MKVKVNYRITIDGELVAVFLGKQRNGKYICYSLYDAMHFEADEDYLREKTKLAKCYRVSELNAFLFNRGYDPEVISRISYK